VTDTDAEWDALLIELEVIIDEWLTTAE